MTTYKMFDIGFVNSAGEDDMTQLDVEDSGCEEKETLELINLILSLKDEMEMEEITSIEFVGREEN